mmetsp:Transcript_15018/g.23252  ORF Transcript_15018/g.23252 Transcript_15018/m.23252 type:complete len:834 (+) Transcript_15018:90-2591(+)
MKFSSILVVGGVGSELLAATANASRLGESSINQQQQRSLDADTYIYQTVNDGYAQLTTSNQSEKEGTPCTAGRTVNYIADAGGDYIDINTDKWSSGGYRMDCMDKGSHTGWQCWASCSPFANPNFMDWGYLTFEVRVSGVFDDVCKPSISVTKRWPSYGSNVVALEGDYIDGGSTSDTDWRRVVIPIAEFSTEEWPNLDGVKDMYFRTCGTAYSVSPRYHVRDFYLTDDPPSVESYSAEPSEFPTLAPPMDDILLATHRKIHTNWYPIFDAGREPEGNSWYVVENNLWPDISASPAPRTATVFIPAGQNVVYSTDDGAVYDKIIIEGALTIEPVDADVKLVTGTIVVEKGGSLDILTNESEHTVVVEFDGALDTTVDPEEIMLGILALEGSLTIKGNAVPRKMAPLSQAVIAGSNTAVFDEDLFFQVGDEVVVPDTQEGLNVGHWNFPAIDDYSDQTETCTIVAASGNQVICAAAFEHDHSIGSNVAFTTRSIVIKTSQTSTDRGHILHTGEGKFDVRNARIENCGRTTTELISNTVMTPDADFDFPEGFAKMIVSTYAENQIARYALHAHNSLVEAYYSGLAVLPVGRDGMVAHNSRVHIDDNVVIGADGTGIFLEDGTETGPVTNNYIIGKGGGSRGGDDGRFSLSSGIDMAHGGFGIWVRGKLALVEGNHCEGNFGRAPYAFFVHPNFMKDKIVPDVSGTDSFLAGKKVGDIEPTHTNGLHLQSFGGFVGNTAVGSFQVGIDLSYFSVKDGDEVGSIIEGASIRNLAKNGRGISTIHSRVFTLKEVTIEGTVEDNTITGIFCNNCNGCILSTPNTTLVVENVMTVRGGNC